MLTPLAKLVAPQGEVAKLGRTILQGIYRGWGGNSGKWPALGKYGDLK